MDGLGHMTYFKDKENLKMYFCKTIFSIIKSKLQLPHLIGLKGRWA